MISALASRIKPRVWIQRIYPTAPPGRRSSSSLSPEMSSLFEPLKLGSVTLSNRVGMSSMTRNRATNTIPTDLMAEYYAQRATGGAGLIVTEGTLVTRQGFVNFRVLLMFILNCLFCSTEWPLAPGIWNKDQIAGWKKTTDAVHNAGSTIYAQVGNHHSLISHCMLMVSTVMAWYITRETYQTTYSLFH